MIGFPTDPFTLFQVQQFLGGWLKDADGSPINKNMEQATILKLCRQGNLGVLVDEARSLECLERMVALEACRRCLGCSCVLWCLHVFYQSLVRVVLSSWGNE